MIGVPQISQRTVLPPSHSKRRCHLLDLCAFSFGLSCCSRCFSDGFTTLMLIQTIIATTASKPNIRCHLTPGERSQSANQISRGEETVFSSLNCQEPLRSHAPLLPISKIFG